MIPAIRSVTRHVCAGISAVALVMGPGAANVAARQAPVPEAAPQRVDQPGVTDNLQEDIKKARMLPVSTILDGFHRLVRDVARRERKHAILELYGTETEVDKRVLELIKDPLMHLLRNAVSHGIEPPEERAEAGKSPAGRIAVRTFQTGGQIQIRIEDDGMGFDTATVVGLAAYAFTCGLVVAIGEAMRGAQSRARDRGEVLQVTLSSIGDAVITTDLQARVTYLNAVAEALTGWTTAEAAGQRPRGLATLFALPGALATVDSRISAPPGIADAAGLSRRWVAHRTQTNELVGDAFVEALSARLRRHLKAAPAPAPSA